MKRNPHRQIALPTFTPEDESWLELSLLVYQADQRFREGKRLTPYQLRNLRKACGGLLPAEGEVSR